VFDYQVPSILRSLVELGRRFAEPLDAAERLAENAHLDPEAGVRLRNLRQLVVEFPEDPKTLEALRISGSDPSPRVRFLAARELGAEGVDILLELEESDVEDDTWSAWSAQTISILSRELTFDRARGVLVGALRKRRIGTARAFIQILGHFEDAAAVAMLAKVLAIETGELAEAAALALGATGNEAAEAPLIEALRRESTDVRMAAANALARVGSAAAVLPLKEAAGKGSLRHPELCRAARQAITEIQSRLQGAAPGQLSLALPGASPGQLSLAGAEEGRLSLTEAEEGRLSLAADPAGQLSIPNPEDERRVK
jgi:HEAT repeat protein